MRALTFAVIAALGSLIVVRPAVAVRASTISRSDVIHLHDLIETGSKLSTDIMQTETYNSSGEEFRCVQNISSTVLSITYILEADTHLLQTASAMHEHNDEILALASAYGFNRIALDALKGYRGVINTTLGQCSDVPIVIMRAQQVIGFFDRVEGVLRPLGERMGAQIPGQFR